jgi:hypothetical protein
MEAPEPPHQHPHHTGHSWLDIILALSAMFVSVVSLFLAIGHGRTMERMAEANARMVEANSWPFVAFETHNVDEQGRADVRLVLRNQGIGPARIQTLEMWYDKRPIASPLDLIKACCETTPAEQTGVNKTIWSTGLSAPSILRAGDHSDFFSAPLGKDNKDLWAKFNVERDKVTVRLCYCSVFDECWIGSGVTTEARSVGSCPVPEVPFRMGN